MSTSPKAFCPIQDYDYWIVFGGYFDSFVKGLYKHFRTHTELTWGERRVPGGLLDQLLGNAAVAVLGPGGGFPVESSAGVPGADCFCDGKTASHPLGSKFCAYAAVPAPEPCFFHPDQLRKGCMECQRAPTEGGDAICPDCNRSKSQSPHKLCEKSGFHEYDQLGGVPRHEYGPGWHRYMDGQGGGYTEPTPMTTNQDAALDEPRQIPAHGEGYGHPAHEARDPVPESCNCPMSNPHISGWHSWWCLALKETHND